MMHYGQHTGEKWPRELGVAVICKGDQVEVRGTGDRALVTGFGRVKVKVLLDGVGVRFFYPDRLVLIDRLRPVMSVQDAYAVGCEQ